MVKKIREYWFGILLLGMVIVSLVFAMVVAVAPHNDLKMRGFSLCTFQMAQNLSEDTAKRDVWGILSTIAKANFCYAGVISEGVELWFSGKQNTPWANYLFEPLTFEVTPEEREPYSLDLIKANRFKDDNELFNIMTTKEPSDEKMQK